MHAGWDESSVSEGGEDAPFDVFDARYRRRLIGFFLRLGLDASTSEDLTQEVLARAYNSEIHVDAYRRDLWPWLSTVARRLAFDLKAKHSTWRETPVPEHLPTWQMDTDTPDAVFQTRQRAGGIESAFAGMPVRHRRILWRYYVEGRSYDELVETEGISVDSLKSVLARARRAFRTSYRSIAERGGFAGVLGAWLDRLRGRCRQASARLATSQHFRVPALQDSALSLFAAVAVAMTIAPSATPGHHEVNDRDRDRLVALVSDDVISMKPARTGEDRAGRSHLPADRETGSNRVRVAARSTLDSAGVAPVSLDAHVTATADDSGVRRRGRVRNSAGDATDGETYDEGKIHCDGVTGSAVCRLVTFMPPPVKDAQGAGIQ